MIRTNVKMQTMKTYNGEVLEIPLGFDTWKKKTVNLDLFPWDTILVISKPRYGKTSLAMDLIVRASKEGRKVFIFDWNGEWARRTTDYNWYAKQPMKLNDVAVFKDFVLPISEFADANSLASFGFSSDAVRYLMNIASNGYSYHHDNVERFHKILIDLPIKGEELLDFNSKYREHGLHLDTYMNTMTKNSLLTHFQFVRYALWQGQDDPRRMINWESAWKNNQNVIVDLSMGKGKTDINVARAYCGAILKRVKHLHRDTKPLFVFEEAWNLFPSLPDDYFSPSSVVEGIELVTTQPKYNVATLLIMQDESQANSRILGMAQAKIIGIADGQGEEYNLAKKNRWFPKDGYREFLYWRVNRRYSRFVPHKSCCRTR